MRVDGFNYDQQVSSRLDHCLCIRTKNAVQVVDKREIKFIQADSTYCVVHCIGNKKYIVSKPLKQFLLSSQSDYFIRIHARYAVNMNHISSVMFKEGGWVELSDGTTLPISRRKRRQVLKTIQGIS